MGGLFVSQLLTLFTTPVVYVYMDRLRLALGGGKEEMVRSVTAPPAARPSPAH